MGIKHKLGALVSAVTAVFASGMTATAAQQNKEETVLESDDHFDKHPASSRLDDQIVMIMMQEGLITESSPPPPAKTSPEALDSLAENSGFIGTPDPSHGRRLANNLSVELSKLDITGIELTAPLIGEIGTLKPKGINGSAELIRYFGENRETALSLQYENRSATHSVAAYKDPTSRDHYPEKKIMVLLKHDF